MRFINAARTLEGVLELAVEAVGRDRVRPYSSHGGGLKEFRIDLALERDSNCYLVLERDSIGGLWVFILDLAGKEIDSWHESELNDPTILRKLWKLCRSRLFTADTEEALEDLKGYFRLKIGE